MKHKMIYGFYGDEKGKWHLQKMVDTGKSGFARWDRTDVMVGSKKKIMKECERLNREISEQR